MKRRWSVLAAGAVAAGLLLLQSLQAAERVWFVPWRVLEPGSLAPSSLLVLYWIPASPEELRRSELATSQVLTSYAGRCVAMCVIRADDVERRLSLGADGPLPVVLLWDGEKELGRVAHSGGGLNPRAVESLVRAQIDTLEGDAERALDQARMLAAAGHHQRAASIYQSIVDRRCAFPRLAREAQRAMKRLSRK